MNDADLEAIVENMQRAMHAELQRANDLAVRIVELEAELNLTREAYELASEFLPQRADLEDPDDIEAHVFLEHLHNDLVELRKTSGERVGIIDQIRREAAATHEAVLNEAHRRHAEEHDELVAARGAASPFGVEAGKLPDLLTAQRERAEALLLALNQYRSMHLAQNPGCQCSACQMFAELRP